MWLALAGFDFDSEVSCERDLSADVVSERIRPGPQPPPCTVAPTASGDSGGESGGGDGGGRDLEFGGGGENDDSPAYPQVGPTPCASSNVTFQSLDPSITLEAAVDAAADDAAAAWDGWASAELVRQLRAL